MPETISFIEDLLQLQLPFHWILNSRRTYCISNAEYGLHCIAVFIISVQLLTGVTWHLDGYEINLKCRLQKGDGPTSTYFNIVTFYNMMISVLVSDLVIEMGAYE